MRCLTRQSIFWLVLAAHLVAFEWGPTLHRWQCSATYSSTAATGYGGCCGQQRVCGPAPATLEEPQSDDSSPEPERHDPQHCSVCKIYAHSPALPVATATVLSVEAGHHLQVPLLPQVVEPAHGGYLARGPPCWS